MHGQFEGSIDLTHSEHHVLSPFKFCVILQFFSDF
jgi:hypothetical protein